MCVNDFFNLSERFEFTLSTILIQMKPLTDADLALLAPKISSVTMRNIAVQRLGISDAEVETLSDECRKNKESFVYQVLIRWRNGNISFAREVGMLPLFRFKKYRAKIFYSNKRFQVAFRCR